MAQIAVEEDVKVNRKQRKSYSWRTEFLLPPPGVKTEPHAFLAERTSAGIIHPHYHEVDQFQVIVSGGGRIGKHGLAVHAVHFARAYTPYGSIVPGEEGLAFLTLRPTRDPGGQYLPGAKDKLKSIPNRRPWQTTEAPKFAESGNVFVHKFSRIKDERGLAAFSLRLKPFAETSAPDPSMTNGQYVIITKGGVMYQGKHHKALSIIFMKHDEQPFQLVAGAEGLDALVLNFPRNTAEVQTDKVPSTANTAGTRVWQCQLCSFNYDEAKGMPEEGVPPGTRWEAVPETWTCPDCSAAKSDFKMEEAG